MHRAPSRQLPADTAAPTGVSGLNPLIETKLWRNPCWFTFRLNYLALRYNVPLYGWVQERYGLSRPEFVVIFSLGLHGRGLARDIASSTGFPKNTLSRAIQKLVRLELIDRQTDPGDRRSQILSLTESGELIFTDTLSTFVEFEQRMLRSLSPEERDTLSRLMAKMVLDSVNWPNAVEDARAGGGEERGEEPHADR